MKFVTYTYIYVYDLINVSTWTEQAVITEFLLFRFILSSQALIYLLIVKISLYIYPIFFNYYFFIIINRSYICMTSFRFKEKDSMSQLASNGKHLCWIDMHFRVAWNVETYAMRYRHDIANLLCLDGTLLYPCWSGHKVGQENKKAGVDRYVGR